MLAAFYRGHLHIQKHQKDHEVRLDLFQDQPILDLKACPIDNNCVKQTDDMEYNFGYI